MKTNKKREPKYIGPAGWNRKEITMARAKAATIDEVKMLMNDETTTSIAYDGPEGGVFYRLLTGGWAWSPIGIKTTGKSI